MSHSVTIWRIFRNAKEFRLILTNSKYINDFMNIQRLKLALVIYVFILCLNSNEKKIAKTV